MAFDFIKDILMSKDDKRRLGHIRMLLAAALADGKLDKTEEAMLARIAQREGISDKEYQDLIKRKLFNYTIPEDEETKRKYLIDLTCIILADGKIASKEIDVLHSIAKGFGFSSEDMKGILDEAHAFLSENGSDKKDETASKEPDPGSIQNAEGEEGRYYFYEDRCSFHLPKEDIKEDISEKGGLKHILNSASIGMVIIEIRPSIPNFGDSPIHTEEFEVAGYPCLGAYLKTPYGLLTQFYINCDNFVVQVYLPNQNTAKEMDFLNSFRKEGAVPEKHNASHVDYVKELEKVIYEYCETSYQSKPNFHIHKYINFKRNLNFDGIDMAEISMAFEKRFHVRIPDDHPYNHRPADDTDFTVGYFLSAYGLIDYESPKKNDQINGTKYVWIIGFYDWDWNKPNPWGNPTYCFIPNPNSRIEKDKKPEIGDSFESKGESLYVEKCEFHQKLTNGTEEYYVVPTKTKP